METWTYGIQFSVSADWENFRIHVVISFHITWKYREMFFTLITSNGNNWKWADFTATKNRAVVRAVEEGSRQFRGYSLFNMVHTFKYLHVSWNVNWRIILDSNSVVFARYICCILIHVAKEKKYRTICILEEYISSCRKYCSSPKNQYFSIPIGHLKCFSLDAWVGVDFESVVPFFLYSRRKDSHPEILRQLGNIRSRN